MIPLFQKLYDQDILVNALMDRSIGHIPLLRSREIPLMTDLSRPAYQRFSAAFVFGVLFSINGWTLKDRFFSITSTL